jgi:DNA-binding MarR family transcriptional regulator
MTRRAGAAVALGPLAGLAGFRLAQAQHAATRMYEAAVGQPLGLRKVEFSLLMLLRANGPLTPKQLAQALWMSAPALTAVLDRLQARGLLERRPHPDDGRSQQVLPTDAGAALAEAAAQATEGMEGPLLQRLSPAERAMLLELLGKLAG